MVTTCVAASTLTSDGFLELTNKEKPLESTRSFVPTFIIAQLNTQAVSTSPSAHTEAGIEVESAHWDKLDEGLYLGEFYPEQKSAITDYPIIILKISPQHYSFKLMSASENGGKTRTPKQWCEEFDMLAAINASMYLKDHNLKSTGYMRNFTHINNPDVNNSFGAFMVFNPTNTLLPQVQIIDRYKQDWRELTKKYNTVIQNYRMISLDRENVWKQTNKAHRTTSVGVDNDGNVLFIFSRSPYATHDFNNILLTLPINIKNAMYVEGGPEANLYITNQWEEIEKIGRDETEFSKHENPKSGWKVPNVIGIVKRRK
ncbi:MAG: phosphodiester glycosidase family protein [bacterium]